MKLSDFAAILEQASLPVTYRAFKIGNAPDLPYLVYYESSPAINAADNTVNHQIKSVTVELAFESKDEDLEERLEELWTTHELFFDSQVTRIKHVTSFTTVQRAVQAMAQKPRTVQTSMSVNLALKQVLVLWTQLLNVLSHQLIIRKFMTTGSKKCMNLLRLQLKEKIYA